MDRSGGGVCVGRENDLIGREGKSFNHKGHKDHEGNWRSISVDQLDALTSFDQTMFILERALTDPLPWT